jgi:hypothetical protein
MPLETVDYRDGAFLRLGALKTMSVPMARVAELSRELESRPLGPVGLGSDVNTGELIDICLAENQRRMSLYDRRLLRPTLVPALARLARRFLRS